MAGQGSGALGSGIDVLDVCPNLFSAPRIIENHTAVTFDYRKKVVEIVRQTAGEAAHCFHFLGLTELLFQHALFRHIGNEANHVAYFSRFIEDELALILHRHIVATFLTHAIFNVQRL